MQRRLPWLIAAAMLLIYLITLSRWVAFPSVAIHAKALGWDLNPILYSPLYFLLTYPIRFLPGNFQVTALNLFSALCSTATVALLARSVAILPQDRTRDQRQLEQSEFSFLTLRTNWIPPVLAALVCALQLTFWEHAVSASGEALDLLIFAWIIRDLLEFRIDGRVSRLYRTTFIYGLAITNNFAMIGFLPAFALAVAWIRGSDFFNARFLMRIALFGAAGLCLYLALPIIYSTTAGANLSFFEMLKMNIGSQKNALLAFPRFLLLLIGLTSLFPVFFMGIKWPAQFGETSAAGAALTNLMTHVIHGVFLLSCLYVAFDPAFSPRKLGEGYGYPMLSFYYLGALSIGYFAGYFLLVFGPGTVGKAWQKRPSLFRAALNYTIRLAILAAVAGVPAALVWQNLPVLRTDMGAHFAKSGTLAAQSLPPQGAVVLSDDVTRLNALEAALLERGNRESYILVSTAALADQEYHHRMQRRYGQRWPVLARKLPPKAPVDVPSILECVGRLMQGNEVYYLHPSFGYYFEHYYLKPQNIVYRMLPLSSNELSGPICSATELKENDTFWQSIRSGELASVIHATKQDRTRRRQGLFLDPVATLYSRALNYLGAEFQKAGDLEKAGRYFEFALELNPDNPAAFINLDYNAILRAGKHESPNPSEGAIKRLGPYGGSWDAILSYNGPVDEPNSCFLLAERLALGRNYRQAAIQLARATQLMPEFLPARLSLGGTLVRAGFPDKALEVVKETRDFIAGKQVATADRLGLVETEALAYNAKNDLPTAEKLLTETQEKYPLRATPFVTLAEIYRMRKDITNALNVLDRQLKNQPEEVTALINYGALLMNVERFSDAIPYFDRALKLKPQQPFALMNRAIAQLRSGKLDGAQQDYEQLERLLPKANQQVYYGLGEIASRKKNYKSAIEYFDKYLRIAPAGSPETQTIRERMRALKNNRPI